jgi:serine phosphatase RsbU (regulator of sigma subunit)
MLAAVVGLGALAATFSLIDKRDDVRAADERAADVAAAQVSAALQETVGAVRGVDVMAVDGTVDADEFAAFANDAVNGTLYSALAYAATVPEAERPSFEAATGLTVRDTDGAGGFVPAASRPQSFVVEHVFPLNENTSPILGFDIASDPTRRRAAEAAERSSEPVVSDRTVTATGARAGVSVVQAVRTPDGVPVGFVTSGLVIDELLRRAGVDVERFDSFSLTMDGEVLAGTPSAGTSSAGTSSDDESATFDVAGRTFSVEVDTGRRLAPTVPLLITVATLVIAAAILMSARRDRRQRARLALGVQRSRGIADLGQRLASSIDSAAVMNEVLEHGGRILQADHVNVATRSDDDPAALVVRHDAGMDAQLAARFSIQPVDADLPVATCVRTAEPVVLRDLDDYRDRYPHVLEEVRQAGVQSVICVPMTFSDGRCVGALGFAWLEPSTSAECDERLVAATTIAELAGRALERAVITEIVEGSASSLGTFAKELAAAHTPADVAEAVRSGAPLILSARSARLELAADAAVTAGNAGHRAAEDGVGTRVTVRDSAGRRAGRLVVAWRSDDQPNATQQAMFTTLAEMVGQTLRRAALSEQEHQLIVQLQRDLLPPPVLVEGLEVAVTYEPAMSVIGLGGDFYDVIVSDTERVYLVIGDVTGHGSEAVAAMAELKSVVQHLLRSDAPIDAVCEQADLILVRRGILATAQIVEVDRTARRLRYINAGHPPPVLLHAGSADLLLGGHRPLLGLEPAPSTISSSSSASSSAPSSASSSVVSSASTAPADAPFEDGDVLVLYTDGLVERRRRDLDAAIEHLRHTVSSANGDSMDELVARLLLANRVTASHRADDDVAIIAVRAGASPGTGAGTPE